MKRPGAIWHERGVPCVEDRPSAPRHQAQSKLIIYGRTRSFCPRPFHFWWWPGVGRWRSETCVRAWLRMVYVDIASWNRLSLRMHVFNGRLCFLQAWRWGCVWRPSDAACACPRSKCSRMGRDRPVPTQCPHSARTVPTQCPHSAHSSFATFGARHRIVIFILI